MNGRNSKDEPGQNNQAMGSGAVTSTGGAVFYSIPISFAQGYVSGGYPLTSTITSTFRPVGTSSGLVTFQINDSHEIQVIPRENASEPIYGWRWWWLSPKGMLKPLFGSQGEAWQWNQRASCRGMITALVGGANPPHDIQYCSCGYYSTKVPDMSLWDGQAGLHLFVFGKIKCEGTVIEHEDGYRSEYALPVFICAEHRRFSYMNYDNKLTSEQCMDQYQCELADERKLFKQLANNYHCRVYVVPHDARGDDLLDPQRYFPTYFDPEHPLDKELRELVATKSD